MSETKICTKCGIEKPATTEFFYIIKGYMARSCIECRNEYMTLYRKSHKEELRQSKIKYNKSHASENAKTHKIYHEANKVKSNLQSAEWREQNASKQL